MLAEAGIACRRHKCAHLDRHGHVHMHPGLACILWCSMDMYTCTVPTFPPVEFSWTCVDMYTCTLAWPDLLAIQFSWTHIRSTQ